MAVVSLIWEATSIDIHRCPSQTIAIVTHLVTRSDCTLGAALTISLGISAATRSPVQPQARGQRNYPRVPVKPVT